MKQAIKERLKKYPFVVSLVLRIYNVFFPAPGHSTIQRNILKNLKHKDFVFFIQVGSNDGKMGDPIDNIIVTNNNWKGIFSEPVGFLFERLKQNYGISDRFIF